MEEQKPKKMSNKVKVQKNVELVSLIASQIEDMSVGERIRVTPFAHNMEMSSGSHPHVETVKGKLMEAYLWQDLTRKIKFYKKGNMIVEIEKVDDQEESDVSLLVKGEIRTDLNVLKNKVDQFEKEIKEIRDSISQIIKTKISEEQKLNRIEDNMLELKDLVKGMKAK